MQEDSVCLLAGEKRLKVDYKGQDVLSKIKKDYMTGIFHQDVAFAYRLE